MITVAAPLPRVCHRLTWCLSLAIVCSGGYSSEAPASAGQLDDAALDNDPAQIRCTLVSAALNFGNLQVPLRTTYVGVGEVTAVCHNPSSSTRRSELTLTFPTVGPQGAVLQSGHGTLAIMFYRDPQRIERWGADRNGADLQLELMAGEQRRLTLSVHAVLQASRNSQAGVYITHLPVTLTARSIRASLQPR